MPRKKVENREAGTVTTRTEWLHERVRESDFAQWFDAQDALQIYVQLVAKPITEIPGEGTTTVLLALADIRPIIAAGEWGGITAREAMWLDVEAQALTISQTAEAAMLIDEYLLALYGNLDVPLVQAVGDVLASHREGHKTADEAAQLGEALIGCLSASGKLSPESTSALQAAMVIDAPPTYEIGLSEVEEMTGSAAWFSVAEVQAAIGVITYT